jgi:hypothetical protein
MGRIIPYMKWKIKFMFQTTNQLVYYSHPQLEKEIPTNFMVIKTFPSMTTLWLFVNS